MPTSTSATPASGATPADVFYRLAAALSSGAWDEISACYAKDAVAELPFALPEPGRVEGRATLHERFTRLGGVFADITVENIRIHRTDDPEVIVAEFDYRGRALAGGREFAVANIQVLRIRDGLIVETRDYHDHAALALATGAFATLAATLPDASLHRTPIAPAA